MREIGVGPPAICVALGGCGFALALACALAAWFHRRRGADAAARATFVLGAALVALFSSPAIASLLTGFAHL